LDRNPVTGKGLLQRLLAVTGAGLVFLVWSEYVFVNDDPARALASGTCPTSP